MALTVPATAFVIVVMMLFTIIFDGMINPRPYFDEQPQSLKLTESRMNWVHLTNEERIYLLGTISNQSEFPWTDVELNYRFFDKSGNMIDAGNALTGCNILPHDEAAFRISIRTSQPANEYGSFKLSVSSARSARSRF